MTSWMVLTDIFVLDADLQLLRFFQRFLDCAHHVERLLRNVVVLAFDDLLEAANAIFDFYVFASRPVNCAATNMGCERNLSILRARATVRLSSSESSSMPRMAMMSCRSL